MNRANELLNSIKSELECPPATQSGIVDSFWDEPVVDYTYYDLYDEDDRLISSEKDGKKVTLNKPFRTSDGPKKFSVYVKNDKGNVVKVNFGSPEKDMDIKRDNPERKKSFRARFKCDEQKDRTSPAYWSCKFWSNTKVSDMV